MEGISRAKCDLLHKILIDYDVDVLAIQETHTETEDQLRSRARIPGYELIGATYNRSYGTATYIRNTIENATLKRASTSNNIHEITIQVGEITVNNIYKPPLAPWPQHVIQPFLHPAVYIGDFNSHHTKWKYRENYLNGESLMDWSDEHNLYLVFKICVSFLQTAMNIRFQLHELSWMIFHIANIALC